MEDFIVSSDMKICAVVVLYNPDESVYGNILSYINSVKKVYMVDNSDKVFFPINQIEHESEKIEYISNNGNKGIANALNEGIKHAIDEGYNYVLTMDQDSRFLPGDIQKLIDTIEKKNNKIGMIAPQSYENELQLHPFSDIVCITSGSILNLGICQKVGTFNEMLFIDAVDTEYCLRMHKKGFKLKRTPSVVLDHHIGETRKSKFLFWSFYTTNHSALRRYYMSRNRFYTWNKFKNDYPEFIRYEKIVTLKEIIKIILVESNKLEKIKMFIYGYLDYKKNKFGKYEED